MRSLLLATAVLAFSVGTAAAQDATYNWSGAYIGIQSGYGWGDSHLEVVGPVGTGNYADPNPDGFLGGVYSGYNHQFPNNVVVGGESDIAYANIKGSDLGRDPSGVPFPPAFRAEISGQVKWAGALRGRVGYAAGRFLPYATGGIAFAHYKVALDQGLFGRVVEKKILTGWTIGSGVEYAFSDHLLGRVEYRYTDFGNERWFFGDSDVNLDSHDLRFGIAYKF